MYEQYKRTGIEPGGDVFFETSQGNVGKRAQRPSKSHGEITTVIDKVYDYISNRESTSLAELSLRMGINKTQMEQMVEMLERGGLVQLKYSILPGENADVWVMNKHSQLAKTEISEEEKIRDLKKVLNEDMNRIDDAFTSIEHHLHSWSSDVEDNVVALNGSAPTVLRKTNLESKEIQRDLELVLFRVNKRVTLLNSRLSEMRKNISSEIKTEDNGQKMFLEKLLSLPNNTYFRFFGGQKPEDQETAILSSSQKDEGFIESPMEKDEERMVFKETRIRRVRKNGRMRAKRWGNGKKKIKVTTFKKRNQ
ncbi:MAG: FeoC-like transcriptional regulator [Candidatus Micrarchaeota archaeon]